MLQIVDTVNAARPGAHCEACVYDRITDADLIAIAGDLFDGHLEHLKRAAEPLSMLNAPMGVYFATGCINAIIFRIDFIAGNHEYYHGHIDEWLRFLKSINIRSLRNTNYRVDKKGVHTGNIGQDRLCIAGVDDISAEKSGLLHLHRLSQVNFFSESPVIR